MRTLEDNNDGPDEQHRANVGVALVHLNTSEDEPGDVADRMRLGQSFSETTGNPLPPLPVMKGNEALFQQAIDDKLNATILQQAPRLAGWLAADPTNAALAKDSVHDLAWWEKHAQDATSASGVFADGTTMAASGPSPAFANLPAPPVPQAPPGGPYPNVSVEKGARLQPPPGEPSLDGTVAGGSGQSPAPADAVVSAPAVPQAPAGEPYPTVVIGKSARSPVLPGEPHSDGAAVAGSGQPMASADAGATGASQALPSDSYPTVAAVKGDRPKIRPGESYPDGIAVKGANPSPAFLYASAKMDLINRIANAKSLSHEGVDELKYDINTQTLIDPIIAGAVLSQFLNGNLSQDLTRANLGDEEAQARIDANSFNWSQNKWEALKGFTSQLLSEGGIMLEGGGQLISSDDPESAEPIIQSLLTARSLPKEQQDKLWSELSKQTHFNPIILKTVFSDVASGQMSDAMARIVLGDADGGIPWDIRTLGAVIIDYSEHMLPAAPGFENSPGRQFGIMAAKKGIPQVFNLAGKRYPWLPALYNVLDHSGQLAHNARKLGAGEHLQRVLAYTGGLTGLNDSVQIGPTFGDVLSGSSSMGRYAGWYELGSDFKAQNRQVIYKLMAPGPGDKDRPLYRQAADEFEWENGLGPLMHSVGVDSAIEKIKASVTDAVRRAMQSPEEADQHRGVMQTASQQAQSSELRKHSPDHYEDAVGHMVTGTPLEKFYVPADKLDSYLKSKDIDSQSFFNGLRGVTKQDFDTALAGKSDLKIPTATYVARLAGSEHDRFFLDNMRSDPAHMTFAEAQSAREARARDGQISGAAQAVPQSNAVLRFRNIDHSHARKRPQSQTPATQPPVQ